MMTTEEGKFAIELNNLTFSFGREPILEDITLNLNHGSFTLLVGQNGAGKSTLLRLIAGRRMVKSGLLVLGGNPFTETVQGLAYLGTEWASNPVVKRDVQVEQLIQTLGGRGIYKKKCDELIQCLNVDTNWSMHEISDGQRRRVQCVLGLMTDWKVLLLDEVTVDLDVHVRARLLRFLKNECVSCRALLGSIEDSAWLCL